MKRITLKEYDLIELISKYRIQIMAFAALWILLFHTWIPIFENIPLVSFAEAFLKRIGYCGVDIFFFLSGMGLVYSINKTTSLKLFYLKRLKRIAVPFLVIAVIRCIINKWSFLYFLKAVTGYLFWTDSIYALLWFVPGICAFYFLFPFYYKLFNRANNKILFTFSAIGIWLAVSLLLSGHDESDIWGFTNRIPIFLLGILIGYFGYTKTKIKYSRDLVCFFSVLFVLGLIISYLTNYCEVSILIPVSNCCFQNILLTVSISFLLPLFFEIISIDRFKIHPLKFIGSFTLELYCVQELISGLIKDALRTRLDNDLFVNITIVAASVICGFVLYHFNKYLWILIEKTVKRFKNQVKQRK